MLGFPQYNDDLQELVGILHELNEHDKKIGQFLQLTDSDAASTTDYQQYILSHEQHDEYRVLHQEKAELDGRWNLDIREIIRKGYTWNQVPSKREMENYSDWRTANSRKHT